MGINIQGNNQINTGRIQDPIMDPVGIQQVCHLYLINIVVMTSMDHCITTIEKRSVSTKNESTKTNAKNKRLVSFIRLEVGLGFEFS